MLLHVGWFCKICCFTDILREEGTSKGDHEEQEAAYTHDLGNVDCVFEDIHPSLYFLHQERKKRGKLFGRKETRKEESGN